MALQQALVTITGNVGNDPTLYGKDPAKPACVFRMGCTRRYLDQTGTWQQLPTTWIAVKAFRSLALNIMGSIRKGNPVIVCGVLGTEEWAGEDGEMHSRLVLEASKGMGGRGRRDAFAARPRSEQCGARPQLRHHDLPQDGEGVHR